MISPADSVLITEGSEERRKFMNKIISQYDTEYLTSVLQYTKALQQRNKLLKYFNSTGTFDRDTLSVWDHQLVKYGNYVFRERNNLINELIPVFQDHYDGISSGKETVSLNYRSHLSGGDYEDALINSLEKDRYLEYTSLGIHKDDLVFLMDGYPIKALGSQGQQKSYLLALKLAKFDYISKRSEITPILLLDDIFDKFDAERVEQIIKLVGNNRFGQIFITDTHQSRLNDILVVHHVDYKLFKIEDSGVFEAIQNGKCLNEEK